MITYKNDKGEIFHTLDGVRAYLGNISLPAAPSKHLLGLVGITVIETPDQTLEELRTKKLLELKTAFSNVQNDAHCMSSVGFEIDANETANRNIEGLVLVMSDNDKIQFRAYNNEFYFVNKENLIQMRKEIVLNSQKLYALMWQYEKLILSAGTTEELNKIKIEF